MRFPIRLAPEPRVDLATVEVGNLRKNSGRWLTVPPRKEYREGCKGHFRWHPAGKPIPPVRRRQTGRELFENTSTPARMDFGTYGFGWLADVASAPPKNLISIHRSSPLASSRVLRTGGEPVDTTIPVVPPPVPGQKAPLGRRHNPLAKPVFWLNVGR